MPVKNQNTTDFTSRATLTRWRRFHVLRALAVFLFFPLCVEAQVLQLGSHWHKVDHNLKLALCNQDVEILNLLYQDNLESVELEGNLYSFSEPVAQLEIGVAYEVSRNGQIYNLYFTELPVVYVEIDQPLSNEERRPAQWKLVESSGEVLTSHIGINIRGGSSQMWPKKSMRVEFWMDQSGEKNRNVSLLDLRNDDDWILLPMFNEPLRVRNAVSHQLWEDIHQPYYGDIEPDAKSGARTSYVEVFINNTYRGVYLLTERIDRKQLKIAPYSDTLGIEGELYKAKDWGSGTVTFDFAGFYSNNNRNWDGYQMKYPKEEMETEWEELFDLKRFVIQEDDSLFVQNVDSVFHLGNAVDYFIFVNLLFGLDNRGKNVFLAKYAHNQPYFYVPWDLDGVWGNDWSGQEVGYSNSIISNGLFDRWLDNCEETGFGDSLSSRWTALRSGLITAEAMVSRFEQNINFLSSNGVYQREATAWPDFAFSEEQLSYTADWIHHRIGVLDEAFADICVKDFPRPFPDLQDPPCVLFPNPSTGQLGIYHKSFSENMKYTVRDNFGRVVHTGRLQRHTTYLDFSGLNAGIYHVIIEEQQRSEVMKWIKIR